jgi:tetrapyrrole methylase family protein/MazG family protein
VPTAAFENFVEVVRRLRKECPWDREQTHESISYQLIEEAYEVVEAIEGNNLEELRRELGDLLLHVVFHSSIAEDKGEFTLKRVVDDETEKLIRRHPHVFGNVQVAGAKEVKENWEKIKLTEGRNSVVDGVPRELPALLRALRVQDKASKVGFDWQDKEDVWKKVEEEGEELKRESTTGNRERIEEELGDLLFALVNYARFLHVNPEYALRRTVDKFIERFQYVETKLRDQGRDITKTTLEEMDRLWDEAKKGDSFS